MFSKAEFSIAAFPRRGTPQRQDPRAGSGLPSSSHQAGVAKWQTQGT
jgi:hypothetical protein